MLFIIVIIIIIICWVIFNKQNLQSTVKKKVLFGFLIFNEDGA